LDRASAVRLHRRKSATGPAATTFAVLRAASAVGQQTFPLAMPSFMDFCLPWLIPECSAEHSGRLPLLGSGYRRHHKGRRYRFDNAAFKDRVDFAPRPIVDVPAIDVADRIELPWMASAPQRDRRSLIEHPSHRKRQDGFAEALAGELVQFINRSQILMEAWNLKFRIDVAEIVASEGRIRGHAAAQEAPAQRAVAQHGKPRVFSIGQHISFALALE
jgi:hypothetical protein